MRSPIRVLVADDQELFRQGLVTLLSSLEQFVVVAEARNGQEALSLAALHKPDVVLMDLRMPVLDGVQATGQLRAEWPEIKVVVLTTFGDDDSIFDAIRAGALGYLLKDTSSAVLSEAIVQAAAGHSFLAPQVATRLVREIAARAPTQDVADHARIKSLTRREREVLQLLANGAANKDIARCLNVAEGTVKNHITAIFSKLGVNDRLQAALVARQLGRILN